jgi:hypothetical protein
LVANSNTCKCKNDQRRKTNERHIKKCPYNFDA